MTYFAEPSETIRFASKCGDEAYVLDAILTASLWHGGQWSALYAFASTGAVVDGLGAEAEACVKESNRRRESGCEMLSESEEDNLLTMRDICVALESRIEKED